MLSSSLLQPIRHPVYSNLRDNVADTRPWPNDHFQVKDELILALEEMENNPKLKVTRLEPKFENVEVPIRHG